MLVIISVVLATAAAVMATVAVSMLLAGAFVALANLHFNL